WTRATRARGHVSTGHVHAWTPHVNASRRHAARLTCQHRCRRVKRVTYDVWRSRAAWRVSRINVARAHDSRGPCSRFPWPVLTYTASWSFTPSSLSQSPIPALPSSLDESAEVQDP